MQRGIFFRSKTNEVLSVAGDGDELPGDGWQLLTDDPALGLVSIRSLLVEQGLAGESTASDAYWYMPPRKQDDDGPRFVAAQTR